MSILHLPTSDGFNVPTYLADPLEFGATRKAALVVLHEAFAVTPHIRRVAHDYARQDFLCLAPDLLARARAAENPPNPLWQHNVDTDKIGSKTTPRNAPSLQDESSRVLPNLPISQAGLDLARSYISHISREDNLRDIKACIDWLQTHHGHLKIGLIGYCFGGSMAYMGAATWPQDIAACVSYYGGMLADFSAKSRPECPTILHFAEQDRYIPIEETRAALAKNHPAAQFHSYPADHGFNRDDGITYDAACAGLARTRSLTLLENALF